MRDSFEAGDTMVLTFVTSIAPDTAPRFTMFGPNNDTTIVNSVVAQASGATSFYVPQTMPNSADGVYLGEWFAEKSVAGTAYPFYKRFTFNVAKTKPV
jgi:hypothetical protein